MKRRARISDSNNKHSTHACTQTHKQTRKHTNIQVLVVSLALFVYPEPGRFAHCARWSEWSMEAVFGGHGGGEQQQKEQAEDGGKAMGPSAVEEGKATNGDRAVAVASDGVGNGVKA